MKQFRDKYGSMCIAVPIFADKSLCVLARLVLPYGVSGNLQVHGIQNQRNFDFVVSLISCEVQGWINGRVICRSHG